MKKSQSRKASGPPFTREALNVNISGNGPGTGKSTLQFLIAEFLSKLGHRVTVSDACVSEHVLRRTLEAYALTGPPLKVVSQRVHLAVRNNATPEQLAHSLDWKPPPTVAFGYTTIKWKRQPNGSWKNQHGDVMSAKEMQAQSDRLKGTWCKARELGLLE